MENTSPGLCSWAAGDAELGREGTQLGTAPESFSLGWGALPFREKQKLNKMSPSPWDGLALVGSEWMDL